MTGRYYIRVFLEDGRIAYLLHKDRTKWCLRTARKHLKEYIAMHGGIATLEKE